MPRYTSTPSVLSTCSKQQQEQNIQHGLLGNISYEEKLNNLGVIYPKEETSERGYDISLQRHKRLMKSGEPQSVPPVQGAQENTERASVPTRNMIQRHFFCISVTVIRIKNVLLCACVCMNVCIYFKSLSRESQLVNAKLKNWLRFQLPREQEEHCFSDS